MFKNYLMIMFRNLQKHKVLASINIAGLSIGIACCSLLLFFVAYERGFDQFNKNARSIFRPYVENNTASGRTDFDATDYSGATPQSLGEAMKRYFPEVLNYTRIQLPWGDNLIRAGSKVIRAEVSYADPSFFSIFTFPLKYGDARSALNDLNDVVLTASTAGKIFGDDSAVGKSIEISIGGAFRSFRVAAIARDVPANSSVRFSVLGNYEYALKNRDNFYIGNNWHPIAAETFIQLQPGSRLPGDARKLSAFLHDYDPAFVTNMRNSGASWKPGEDPLLLKLQPLLSIHTDTWFRGWGFSDYDQVSPEALWILLVIAVGILLIACINFTTLAIGRMAARSREVGLRKVIGAARRQIIIQFLGEAILLSFVAGAAGLFLADVLLPWFVKLSGRPLQLSAALRFQSILAFVGVILVTGLLAGSYPAIILSGFRPIEVLKNRMRVGGSNPFTRSLVIFQFTLSIILIISTVVIMKQTRFLINKNPGFNKENVVVVDATETDPNAIYPPFKQRLERRSTVMGVASAVAGLGDGYSFLGYSDNGISAELNIIDTGYIRVMGMQLLAGRNLAPGSAGDSIKPIIINESMMRAFGWDLQHALGKQIRNFQGKTAVVTGVVRNFSYGPLSEGIKSQAFETTSDRGYSYFYVRIPPGDPLRAIGDIRRAWSDAAPGTPLKYSFLDEDVNQYYASEQRWSGIVGWAGTISIFLACLGLLGLASLAAVNRTKEIGVRKVLGASVHDILLLISRDFIRLVLLALIVASPLAWFFMTQWLSHYANRVQIGWSVFILAGISVMSVALVTISFFGIKTALADPVKSLRTE